MNSFRPLVYPSIDANATGWVCRDSGLVQGALSTAIPLAADRALAPVGVPRKESCSKAGGATPLNNCLSLRGHFHDWG